MKVGGGVKITEKEWAEKLRESIAAGIQTNEVSVHVGKRVPYRFEMLECSDDRKAKPVSKPIGYATDILVRQDVGNGKWKPRVVIELKINSINTHDSITYSEKAYAHKAVFPYLRYGIVIGNHKGPIPWRLYRHGLNSDFMMVIAGFEPTEKELAELGGILNEEIEASRQVETIIYKQSAFKYRTLHRELILD